MKKTQLVIGALIIAGVIAALAISGDGNMDAARLTPAETFSHIHGIAVDAEDSHRLYIATHEGLFLLTEEGALFHVGSLKSDLMGFTAHPIERKVFFTSGHPSFGGNLGVLMSEDGGMTWQKLSDGLNGPVDFHAMTISPAEPEVLYGFYGRLQRSRDGGATWEYAAGNVQPLSLAAHPTERGVLYAATQGGALISRDYGDSWQSVSPALAQGTVTSIAIHTEDPSHLLAYAEVFGGMGVSTNAGATWEALPETFDRGAVLYIAFSAAQPDTVYVATHHNRIFRSSDRGITWTMLR